MVERVMSCLGLAKALRHFGLKAMSELSSSLDVHTMEL